MAHRQPLNDEQKRLLGIVARMPLASAVNLASVTEATEDQVRGTLKWLHSGGWVSSVKRGMTERRQHRWFLTRRAVDELYVTDHQHPSPREEARAAGLAEFHPEGELPAEFRERFALDHDHLTHQESHAGSPFYPFDPVEDGRDHGSPDHEHPPCTAMSRGLAMSLRRLAMLESVYRLAPNLLKSGRVVRWPDDQAASWDARMTDFRLLRYGGFYHAVARSARTSGPLSPTPESTPPSGCSGARGSTASGAWTATQARRTAISPSATGSSTRTRTRKWNRRPR